MTEQTKPPQAMKAGTIAPTKLQQAQALRAAYRELDHLHACAVRSYAYGSGTLAAVMAIQNEQESIWRELLSLHSLTKEQWMRKTDGERNALWGDCPA